MSQPTGQKQEQERPGATDEEIRQELGDDFTDEDAEKLLNARRGKRQGGGADTEAGNAGDDESGGTGDRKYDEIIAGRKRARQERDQLKAELDKVRAELTQIKDAGLSDSERRDKERDTYKTRAEKAELEVRRWRIAMQRAPEHATTKQVAAVAKRLSGEDDNAMGEDADEMFALIAPPPAASTGARPPTSKPRERLKGGGDPEEDDEIGDDPAKLAGLVPRAI
jgi:hypothetical protein